MKTILVLASVLVATCTAFSNEEYRLTFSDWMHKYQKTYVSDEFQSRFNIFKSNMDFVSAWNADATHTHTVELNSLADLSNEEYQRIYLGTRVQVSAKDLVQEDSNVNDDTVNWVTKGAVTGIKDQGQCGSCWSFSTTGSVEGLHAINTGNLVGLSEQQLMDCSGSYGNNGCNGGLMDYAFQYIKANGGLDTEASYPYQTAQGTCNFNPANVGATIGGYTDVAKGSEAALVSAINNQPISIAIDASHNSFQLYSSGVYYEPACSATALDHGVLAVGYGDNYYIVKNSWGTSWGQQGYIWMSRNRNNNCGVATMASFPTK